MRSTPSASICNPSQHDPMLYSYLLDPTYSSHRLADVALRRFNLKLSGTITTWPKPPTSPSASTINFSR
jgi:DNA polymerase I-like protein with 3'-5' exonuclease and polymerase domains